MEHITLADGTEREVPTAEELKAFQDNAQKVELETKRASDLEAKVKELEPAVHPEWNKVREKIKFGENLVEKLKAQGKDVDALGNITDVKPAPSLDDVKSAAQVAAKKEYLDGHLQSKLGQYDEETKKVVDFYYKKLTAGEEMDVVKIDKFLGEAETLARPRASRTDRVPTGGHPPRFADEVVSDVAKSLAGDFGIPVEELQKGGRLSRI